MADGSGIELGQHYSLEPIGDRHAKLVGPGLSLTVRRDAASDAWVHALSDGLLRALEAAYAAGAAAREKQINEQADTLGAFLVGSGARQGRPFWLIDEEPAEEWSEQFTDALRQAAQERLAESTRRKP